MSEKRDDHRPAAFAWMVPHISQVARTYGYAIGLHGSMARDLDLIAVPWVDSASPAEVLVEAIREAVDGFIRNDPQHEGNRYHLDTINPSDKPPNKL